LLHASKRRVHALALTVAAFALLAFAPGALAATLTVDGSGNLVYTAADSTVSAVEFDETAPATVQVHEVTSGRSLSVPNQTYGPYTDTDTITPSGNCTADLANDANGDPTFTCTGVTGSVQATTLDSNDVVDGSGSLTGLDVGLTTIPLTADLGAGNDLGVGGAANDTIHGGDDDDDIYGDTGGTGSGSNDTLFGDAGQDSVAGGKGNDNIDGGAGDDNNVVGGPGADTVNGGDGNDGFIAGGPGDDTVSGGAGNDAAVYGDCDGGPCNGLPGGNDTVNGDAGNDSVYGDAGNDTVNGGAGNDYVYGDAGNDTVNGDDGDDNAYGGNGNDTMNGGAGQDNVHGEGGDDNVDGGTGDDGDVAGGPGTDIVNGGDGNDNYVAGGPGDDTVNGGSGADYVVGDCGGYFRCNGNNNTSGATDGNDIVNGDGGDDYIEGDAGTDSISGGTGIDAVEYSDRYSLCSPGPCTLVSNPVTVTVDGVANDGGAGENDTVGTDIEDVYIGYSCCSNTVPEGGATILGNADVNSLSGANGNDTIDGGAGNDFLYGNGGDDTINANDGFADRVYCGDGNDVANVDEFDQVAGDCETVNRTTRGKLATEDAAPTVAWTTPASQAKMSTSQANTLSVTAGDDKGVTQVVFLAGERVLCVATTAPYTCSYRPTDGDVGRTTLTAVAYDASQQTASAARVVNVGRFTPGKVSAKTSPTKDSRAPFTFKTTGKLTLPSGVTKTTGCKGTVTVTFKAGSKTISSRKATLTKSCSYSSKVTFSLPARLHPKTLKITVRYGGNAVLTAKSAKAYSVRTA
jgi:Ca2+-binding RTX toxin-like protein